MSLSLKGLGIAAAAFTGLTATSAYAIQPPNLVTNGSFEDSTHFASGAHFGDDSLSIGSTAMPAWTVVGAGNIGWFSPDVNNPATNYDIAASDGSYSLDLTGSNDAANGGFGGVQQTVNTVQGQTYHLTFDLGSDGQYGVPVKITVGAAGASQDFESSLTNLADGNANAWASQSWDFTATGSKTVLVLQGVEGSKYIGLDNVRLTGPAATSAAPEPAAWALMMIGFGGAGSLLRRRRAERGPARA